MPSWAMPGGGSSKLGLWLWEQKGFSEAGALFWTLKGAGGGTTRVGEDVVAKGHRSCEGARFEYLQVEGRELRAMRAGWGCGF